MHDEVQIVPDLVVVSDVMLVRHILVLKTASGEAWREGGNWGRGRGEEGEREEEGRGRGIE